MDRMHISRSLLRQQGAAIVEAVIALPILLAVILGAIQFGLIYEAKATLNHAALQAARAGAVGNAQPQAVRSGLARGLVPLYSPESSLSGVASTLARITAELATDARIRVLNPTREAFDDFGEEVDGVLEIPNDRLHARSTTVGASSGLNIQDANLLRVQITYGYELKVPLVNWFVSRVLLSVRRGGGTMDAFEQQLLRRMHLPIVATATVRMQSPARMSDMVVARDDLPEVARFPADARPPESSDDEGDDEEQEQSGETGSGDDGGSTLADGFFGFGEGHGAGGGVTPGSNGGAGGGSGSGSGSGTGSGGTNSGNPAQCTAGGSESPFPPGNSPPGESSPVPEQPNPLLSQTNAGEGTIASAGLPSLSVGNPIHVVTGNKFQAETDLRTLPGRLGLTFTRYYNSDSVGRAGVMGAGWRHSYEATLSMASNTVEIVQADGRHLKFARTGSSDIYRAHRGGDGWVQAVESGYLWHLPSGRRLQFDEQGALSTITDGSSSISLIYDEAHKLERVVDAHGRQLRFSYYANGRVSEVSAPAGASWRYLYDESGNLSHVIARDGRARRYDYSDSRHPHHLTAISAGLFKLADYGQQRGFEQIARWEYDEQGRGVLSSHPQDSGKVRLSYGDGYTDVTDAFDRTTRYVTASKGGIAFVSEVRGPGCGCGRGDVVYGINDALQLESLNAKGSPAIRYRYDESQRLKAIERDPGDGYRTLIAYRYDDANTSPSKIELPSIKSGALHVFEFAYRADGQVESVRESGYAPDANAAYVEMERVTRRHYDARGRLIAIDGPRKDVADLYRIEYDALDRPVQFVSPEGIEQRISSFDEAGRPTMIVRTGRPAIKLEYDASGRLTYSGEVRSRGERGSHYVYDVQGRLSEIVDADGRRQRIGYDAAGRPDRMSNDDGAFAAALKYAPDGNVVAAAVLQRNGVPLRGLAYAYDGQRRLIEIRDGDGPPLRQLQYLDDDDRPDRLVDALGGITALAYDAYGYTNAVLAADGGTTKYERDTLGRLTRVIAPNDTEAEYVYDDFGRRVVERSADRGLNRYEYDAVDNLVARTDARGVTTRYHYDADNRLNLVADSEATRRFIYRGAHLESVSSTTSDERFEYSTDGELIEHIRQIEGRRYATRFEYDAAGRVSARTLPSGERLRYLRGTHGELRTIERSKLFAKPVIVSSGGERALSPMTRLQYGNDVGLDDRYDPATGRLQHRAFAGVMKLTYSHDELGRIEAIEDKEEGSIRAFGYDALGRLTAARDSDRAYSFEYDANGNRTATSSIANARQSRRPSARNLTYHEASNRLAAAADDRVHDYDPAGNPVRSGSRRYEYNAAGRPARLYIDDKLVATYAYDAFGQRVSKTLFEDGKRVSMRYVYENQQLIAEADESGQIVREYIYLDRHPIAMIERGTMYWIHTDHLGTPLAVTDADRRIVWRATYEPFGKANTIEDPDRDGIRITLNLRFPGQYADAESGTHYNLMRDYDPETGRYLTPDPLGLFDGTNEYAYVHSNPISGTDPLGLYDAYVHFYMTYFLALVAGLPADAAQRIATATQYIDENPMTSPIAGAVNGSLSRYHFVLDYDRGDHHGDGNSDPIIRMLNVYSDQLGRLHQFAELSTLQVLWAEAHPTGIVGACALPDRDEVLNARYQLYGEYLHAYEDTFAHRDSLNKPYDVYSFNDANDPGATLGHVGSNVPDNSHAPDHSFNQLYRVPSKCVRSQADRRRGPPPRPDMSESKCLAAGGRFIPARESEWAYNELRTLRMEWQVFLAFKRDFAPQIQSNLDQGGRQFAWSDLAGTDRFLVSSSRIGSSDPLPVSAVLQVFNAAPDSQKLEILNNWLRDNGVQDRIPSLDGDHLSNLDWAARTRKEVLQWIPQHAEDDFKVLLPPRRNQRRR